MGNDPSKGTAGGTKLEIKLDRTTAQAGSALKGKIIITVGKDGQELVKKYPAGIVLEAQLFGSEKVYWALNKSHMDGPNGQKRLVPGPNRREQANILIDFKQQLAQLNPMQVSKHNVKIEENFSIPLPENLPSSFFFCGEWMSQLTVQYDLKANLIGLKPAANGLPEGEVVFGVSQIAKIRARDPPAKQGITQEATGETKGALTATGPCTVSGNLPVDVALCKQMVKVVIYINNANCKKMVKKTQLKVHRKITAKAVDIMGVQKEWTDN